MPGVLGEMMVAVRSRVRGDTTTGTRRPPRKPPERGSCGSPGTVAKVETEPPCHAVAVASRQSGA